MSRLVFKESRELPLESYETREQQKEHKQTEKKKPSKASSYELFDLTTEEETRAETTTTTLVDLVEESEKQPHVVDDQKNESSGGLPANTLNKRKKKKKNQQSHQSEEKVEEKELPKEQPKREVQPIEVKTPQPPSKSSNTNGKSDPKSDSQTKSSEVKKDVPVSSFLSKFLSQKRTSLDVEPPPIETSDDTYLRLFHENFTKPSKAPTPKLETEKDQERVSEEDVLEFSDFIVRSEGLLTEEIEASDFSEANDDDSEDDSNEEDDEDFVNSFSLNDSNVSGPAVSTIHLYNLPYEISSEKISEFLEENGINVKSLALGGTERKNMPPGSAVVEVFVSEGFSATDYINAINGKMCGRRPIRAQKSHFDSRKRLSFGKESASRYFENDITCKCVLCGEVGHKQQECTNDPLPQPCHLCAATTHESSECPNITCFRCGQFGHHSRDCVNQGRPRQVVCYECGSTTHDISRCHDYGFQNNSQYESKVEGSWIKCMSCGNNGHALCKKLPVPEKSKDRLFNVYCPNCGEKGHHIDYPPFGRKSLHCDHFDCIIPKYDAFFRYPQLQKEAERLAEKDIDYYDSFVQRKDDKLFPIFFARNIKPLDYSSGGEEDDEEDDIYEQYRAQNMTDSDEEGELDDEDEEDDDDEEGSDQNKNKKKRKRENEKSKKNSNKSNSSNKKRKFESTDKKNGSNSASKNYQSNNNNNNYHQNNNYNNNNNYYNKNNNDNYNYNNNYNNNYNYNNSYKQNSNGSGSKNYQQNKVSGYFQQEKRKSFDGKDRDDYQKDNKKARRESGEDRSSVRDMDGVYLENTSKSNPSSAKKASDDWINRLENRQKRFAKTNQN